MVRAGDVGGAAVVLAAAVAQEERILSHLSCALHAGAVVDDGAVWSLAGDRREGFLAKPRLLGAKLGDPLADLVLVPLLTLRRLLVEPAPEGRHRDTVPEVRLEHARELRLVLHSLG